MKKFTYDVDVHFNGKGWDTYEVKADCVENARFAAVMRVINETGRENAEQIDSVRVYNHGTEKLLKEYAI